MHPFSEELHRSSRIGWLRAAVLGANDGIVSTASLVVGVAAGGASSSEIFLAGTAGLVAGAMSMAAGEYVSVSSQSDTEQADLQRERKELETQPDLELEELAGIYMQRGLQPELAKQVAEQLTAHDAIGTHARDELGISELTAARPIQAAFASAGTFAVGAAIPLLVAWLVPRNAVIAVVIIASLVLLAVLGGWGAQAGGAKIATGAWRVTFWGAIAMALTAVVGWMFGATV
jgi:vacuolar iron transporter family protein